MDIGFRGKTRNTILKKNYAIDTKIARYDKLISGPLTEEAATAAAAAKICLLLVHQDRGTPLTPLLELDRTCCTCKARAKSAEERQRTGWWPTTEEAAQESKTYRFLWGPLLLTAHYRCIDH